MRAAIIGILASTSIVAACPACGEDPPRGTVVLFQDKDVAGADSLFQLDPRTGRVASVAAVEGGALRNAVFAPSGAGGAAIVVGATGTELVRWTGAGAITKRTLPAAFTGRLVAASKDGATVAMTHGQGLAIVTGDAEPRVIDLADLGELAYLVALSNDGKRLAFSTYGKGCGWARDVNRCPVTLYALDLPAPHLARLEVAGGGSAGAGLVAYDPHFLDPAGEQLLYLTSAGDASAECAGDVGKCRYAVHRVRWPGEGSERVIDDAVLARPGRPGAIVFRRLGPDGWSQQSLWLSEAGKERKLADRAWMNRVHAVSPAGDQVAVVLDGAVRVLEVHTLDGTAGASRSVDTSPVVVGWNAAPLSAGSRTLGEPQAVRHLRAAVARARSLAGAAPVATIDVDEVVRRRAAAGATPGTPIDDIGSELAAAWIDKSGVAVTHSDALCDLRRKGVAIEIVERASGGLFIVRKASGTTPEAGQPAVDPTAPAQARFEVGAEGIVELVGVALPPTLRPGTAELALTWRVVQPPPAWKVFVHLDGPRRILADHAAALCGPTGWKAGDVITDRFDVEIPAGAEGRYEVRVGWFKASLRARATLASGDQAVEDRVDIGAVQITGR
jgi:hypothetical protein